jgi:hypothetical protein
MLDPLCVPECYDKMTGGAMGRIAKTSRQVRANRRKAKLRTKERGRRARANR